MKDEEKVLDGGEAVELILAHIDTLKEFKIYQVDTLCKGLFTNYIHKTCNREL